LTAKKKNSLLIIDDEKLNIKLLTHILSPEYAIYTATNGPSGIKIATEYMPDIILLDILMPEMDGYQILSELKRYEKTKNIPVIFITGLDGKKDEEKALALGGVDYITKPFSAIVVKIRVRNQIQMINQLRTIEFLSMHDHLTKLPNRRNFDERLHMEWVRAIREQTTISILMMDLDRFKAVNDTYGHEQGDNVIQNVAGIFRYSLRRPGDFAARWGGEEFAVLLPNTPLSGALDIAERIRANVEGAEIPRSGGETLKITISIGVNSQAPTNESAVSLFLSNSDKALRAAKEAGRNNVHSMATGSAVPVKAAAR